MSRHQDSDRNNPGSGRQGGYRKPSHSRGNSPSGQSYKPKPKPIVESKPESDEIRLNKYIANSGVCTRKEADIYIQSGNVQVNGVPVVEMGFKVKLTDVVVFDGQKIIPEKKEYILLNKPKNFSTSGDINSEKSVYRLVANASRFKLDSIGRMDSSTTGLLVLTNDQELVRKFTQPMQSSQKIYQITLSKNLHGDDLEKISKGVRIDDYKIYVDEVSYIENEPKTEIGIKLRTPNIKVIKAIFEKYGYEVVKIDRVSFAGLTKKNLPRGNWRVLTKQEIINLKHMVP
jgi:23S rRNA pseudouridine2605 synthase